MQLLDKIRELILSPLNELNIDLIELALRGARGNQILQVFIDTECGVTIADCKNASDIISEILDTADIIEGRYRLEVSSPGADRPLKAERDFHRNIGRPIRFNLQQEEQNQIYEGIIQQVSDGNVTLRVDQKAVNFSISQMENVKLILKW
ncbi:ribosome maturation factor RimP [candidate division KSB1 bacterium]|nr:ribosome maturation factor RimP [candidate division KSB1 bacterium]